MKETLTSWEADVVLNDGSIATLRAIRPEDRQGIIDFYTRVSPKSKYLRFFGTHPTLTDEDLEQWINIDHHDRVTLVLVDREEIVATARYEIVPSLLPARVADVSFLVQDDHHGLGAANILLEHLAHIGRECEVERFFAETLTENRAMVQVFVRAGYQVQPELEDGFIVVDFPITASAASKEVMHRRELRAEANSVRRLAHPDSVAVVGSIDDIQHLVPQLVSARFTGTLHVVTADKEQTAAALRSINGQIDLVIVAHDATQAEDVLAAAAEKQASGVIFLAQGHNPTLSRDQAAQFVHQARAYGLRALGPAALGIINTDPAVRLNASPAPLPPRGKVGLFTQSAGVATLVLSHALRRGCGISTFFSSGSFADVTGNDVLQYWADDPGTSVCLLSLDVVGNPRKFFRLLRRLALEKHVVLFIPSRALRSAEQNKPGLVTAPPQVLDQVTQQAGAIVVSRRDAMYDIAEFLAKQPIPSGRRVRVLSNSAGLSAQMCQAAQRFGFDAQEHTVSGDPMGLVAATAQALADTDCDLVFTAAVEINAPIAGQLWVELSELAADPESCLLAMLVGFEEFHPPTPEQVEFGQLPLYSSYADAFEVISLILDNEVVRAAARPRPEDEYGSGDQAAAESVIAEILKDSPQGRWATPSEVAAVLAAYGLDVARLPEQLGTLSVRALEEPVVGPMVAAGDVWRVPPVRRRDAHEMAGTPAAEDVIMAVSKLKDDIPAVVELELAASGARLRVAPCDSERDPLTRSLT